MTVFFCRIYLLSVMFVTYLPTDLLTYLLLPSYSGRNLRDFQHLSHILKE